ncbi:hypothetical protein Taro_016776 [Colocasia esculenta]|uniref:Erythronate-4-phosphate dehydrogenase family protein n=1 Tax=Colocasia esculenta TaxID=4460 RepID=A0A843ULC9_COLES|nr:hypothetical protein [Colocasia esculenta]
MEECYSPLMDHKKFDQNWKIIKHSLYEPMTSPWLDLRIFYMRVSNSAVDESTPECMTLNHIPLSPDTIFEVNGRRSSSYTECVSSTLRRDRVDKKNEEATYVSTDSIRMTGSARFEVYDKDDLLFSGVLELSSSNGFAGETKGCKRWSLSCQQVVTSGNCFLKGRQLTGPESLPIVDVYVTGYFSGAPIILTKTLQLGSWKNCHQKTKLISIPENELTEMMKDFSSEAFQVTATRRRDHEAGNDAGFDYEGLYMRGEYLEGEDGELSWFNAGVRVGVGIGLGLCLGVGLGVGVLVRTYLVTSKHLKWRLS